MNTTHRILYADSRNLLFIPSSSIDLVVTSPPYPMIGMWDGLFTELSPETRSSLDSGDGDAAFESMHRELDKTWSEVYRVLRYGGLAGINIGDATRSIGGKFRLFCNHSRIIAAFRALGFDSLPVILWHKPTNAPNKFMGSGMLPVGAYVTLEHEYVLLFRKGTKREFSLPADKTVRAESAYFWEERNLWFSDVWSFKGAGQTLDGEARRNRSAAFPADLALRLIQMYSVYGDTILDPFAGTATTMLAAIACGRKSIGVELDPTFEPLVRKQVGNVLPWARKIVSARVRNHLDFTNGRIEMGSAPKYVNRHHAFPVVTRQEMGLRLYWPETIAEGEGGAFTVNYGDLPDNR